MVRVTLSVASSIIVTFELSVIEAVAQFTEKFDAVTLGALKFAPFTVAVTVESSLEIPAFGILNKVNFGLPYT